MPGEGWSARARRSSITTTSTLAGTYGTRGRRPIPVETATHEHDGAMWRSSSTPRRPGIDVRAKPSSASRHRHWGSKSARGSEVALEMAELTRRRGESASLTSQFGSGIEGFRDLAEKSALPFALSGRHPEAIREAQPSRSSRTAWACPDGSRSGDGARATVQRREADHVGLWMRASFVEDRPWAVAEPGLRLPVLEVFQST